MQKYVISILVANQFGVLTRVAALFARRGFNIDSLTVGETETPSLSRITVVAHGSAHDKEQMMLQLGKLEDVTEIREMAAHDSMSRELLLIKVGTDSGTRHEILDIVNVFRAKIIDYARDSICIETTGETSKIDAFIDLMRPYGIVKLCRTGIVALERG
ncbi:MAG: acetolactate synthase small subunit [Oscillospiraceae bacterium]|nr:acetolactate synthase small subunit [Oscillospiraceae bacterium]